MLRNVATLKRTALAVVAFMALCLTASAAGEKTLYSYLSNGNWNELTSWTKAVGGKLYEAADEFPGSDTYDVVITENKRIHVPAGVDITINNLQLNGKLIFDSPNSTIRVKNLTGNGEVVFKNIMNLLIDGAPIRQFPEGTVIFEVDDDPATKAVRTITTDHGADYAFRSVTVKSGTICIKSSVSKPLVLAGDLIISGGGTFMFDVPADSKQTILEVGGNLVVKAGGVLTSEGAYDNILRVRGNVDNNGVICGPSIDYGAIESSITQAQKDALKAEADALAAAELVKPVEPTVPVAPAPVENPDEDAQYTVKTEPEVVEEPKPEDAPVLRSTTMRNEYVDIDLSDWGAGTIQVTNTGKNFGYLAVSVSVVGGRITLYGSNTTRIAAGTTVSIEAANDYMSDVRSSGLRVSQSRNTTNISLKVDIIGYMSKKAMDDYENYLIDKAAFEKYVEAKDLYEQYMAYLEAKEKHDVWEKEMNVYNTDLERKKEEKYNELYSLKVQELITAESGDSFLDTENKKLTLEFIGNTDATFANEGLAKLNRIRAAKTDHRTVMVHNIGKVFNVVASTTVKDYKDLPWSVQPGGTLALGEGIDIAAWATPTPTTSAADYTNFTRQFASMYVPCDATLKIAGATVNAGENILIAGTLVVESGELNTSENKIGVLFVKACAGETQSVELPMLRVLGGVVNTNRIASVNTTTPGALDIVDGEVNVTVKGAEGIKPDLLKCSIRLASNSSFLQSGGLLRLNSQYTYTSTGTNGMMIEDVNFNVTGGDIYIYSDSSESRFSIKGARVALSDVHAEGVTIYLHTPEGASMHSMNITSGGLNVGEGDISVSGDIIYNGGSLTHNTTLYMTGAKDSKISSGTNVWNNVVVQKANNATATIEGTLHVKGNLEARYGNLKGEVRLNGNGNQVVVDDEGTAFSGIDLKVSNTAYNRVTAATPENIGKGVCLGSDTYFNSVAFEIRHLFYLGSYNLKLNSAPTGCNYGNQNTIPYTTRPSTIGFKSTMFMTDNTYGAGGVTLPATAGNAVHIGVGADCAYDNSVGYRFYYSKVTCKYTQEGKFFTVTPIYGQHPQVFNKMNINPIFYFYWNIKSDAADIGNNDAYELYVQNENYGVTKYGKTEPEYFTLTARNTMLFSKKGSFVENSVSTRTSTTTPPSYYQLTMKDLVWGDYTLSPKDGVGWTYHTKKSGNWTDDNMWYATNGDGVDQGAKNYWDITYRDNVVIEAGTTVLISKADIDKINARTTMHDSGMNGNKMLNAGMVTVEGKLVIDQEQFEKVYITKMLADGENPKLQFNVTQPAGSVLPKGRSGQGDSDFGNFCNNEKAELILNMNCDRRDANKWSWSLEMLPNLTVRNAKADKTNLISSPSFNDNKKGSWTGELTAVSFECAEMFNANLDLYQNLTGLPQGRYVLTCQGYYRNGGYVAAAAARTAGTEKLLAELYANSVSVPLKSIFEEAGKVGAVGVNPAPYSYIPDNMEQASQYFGAGLYNNSLECTVGADGNLKIGVRKGTTVGDDWVIFDNFTLTYLGPVDPAASSEVTPVVFHYEPSANTTITGNLNIENHVNAKISRNGTGNFTVEGETNVDGNLQLAYGDDQTFEYSFRGGMNVDGTLNNESGKEPVVNIYGDVVNNGTINLAGSTVNILGDKSTSISGTAGWGKTDMGVMTLKKSNGDRQLEIKLPVCGANDICPLEMVVGQFVHNYGDKSDAQRVTYKGADNFLVPAGSMFSVVKGRARIYSPNNNNNRVKMDGDIAVANAELTVGGTDGGTDYYGSIGCVQNSVITASAGSVINIAGIAPFTGVASYDLTSDNSEWNFYDGARNPNYAMFDVCDGSRIKVDATVVGSVFNFRGSCGASKASVYYHPTNSTYKAVTNIYSTCNIDANSPFADVNIAETGNVKLLGNPLTVGNLNIADGGKFDGGIYDLTVKGSLKTVNDADFISEFNTVKFIPAATGYSITAPGGITFNNMTLRTGSESSVFNAAEGSITVKGDLTIEEGVFQLNATKANVHCKQTLTVSESAAIAGKPSAVKTSKVDGKSVVTAAYGWVLMDGTVEQKLVCEGSLSSLLIDNEKGVNSRAPQARPISVGKLYFNSGNLNISSNMLEIMESMDIASTIGKENLIITNANYTDRGVMIHVKANTAKSMKLPMGESGKYTPVIFDKVTPSEDGTFTVYGSNSPLTSIVHYADENRRPHNYLKFYWHVGASSGMSVTSGKLGFIDSKSDAPGWEEADAVAPASGEYKALFLSQKSGLFKKDNNAEGFGCVKFTGTDDPTGETPYVYIYVNLSGSDISGEYTAGCEHDTPIKIETYKSVANGNWDGSVWRQFDLEKNDFVTRAPIKSLTAAEMKGCGFIVARNHNITMNTTGNNTYFLEIEPGAMVDFGTNVQNNMGLITGKGTMKVACGNLPGANYEVFFSKDGGTMEYSGTEDYMTFVDYPYHNNVIFSGSGKREFPSGNVQVFNDLTITGSVNTEIAGKTISVGGNMTVEHFTGVFDGEGYFVFNGENEQKLVLESTTKLPGIGIDNERGLEVNQGLEVDKLLLNDGKITMASGKTLSMSGTKSTIVWNGHENSFVEGMLARWCVAGQNTKFYVGDGERTAFTDVVAVNSGVFRMYYVQAYPGFKNGEGVEQGGFEHWEVYQKDGLQAKLRLRWDEYSEEFRAGESDVLSNYEAAPGYKAYSYTNASNNVNEGTLLTVPLSMIFNGGARKFAFSSTGNADMSYTWLGGTSSEWGNKLNWQSRSVPSRTSDVVIPVVASDVYPVIGLATSGGARAKSIVIEDGAKLTLEGGAVTLIVEEDIKVEGAGEMVVNYDVDANPNLIVNGDQQAPITINRTVTPNRIYYVGSATEERTMEKPVRATDGWGFADLYLKYFDRSVFEFNTNGITAPKFNTYGSGKIAESLVTMAINNKTAPKFTFKQKGHVASANVVEGIEAFWGTCWYSNPFPFALELRKDMFVLDGGGKITDRFRPTVHSRVNVDGTWQYNSYNMATGIATTGHKALAPFQGFEIGCVDGNPYNDNGSINRAMTRFTIKANPFTTQNIQLKGEEIDLNDNVTGNVLRLFAGDEAHADEVVMLFNNEGSYAEGLGDSHKKDNPTISNISTNKGGSKLVISHWPDIMELESNNVSLPLTISKVDGAMELNVWVGNLGEFKHNVGIYLVDNMTGERTDLTFVESVAISNSENLYNGRFELAFEARQVENGDAEELGTVTGTVAEQLAKRIVIGTTEQDEVKVMIYGDIAEGATATVYDLMGRIVMQKSLQEHSTLLKTPQKGLYVVKVLNGESEKSVKTVL